MGVNDVVGRGVIGHWEGDRTVEVMIYIMIANV